MKNEKSTFSVLFYLKKDKMKKNGLVPIHARITIDGKQTQFNTKLEVLETNWQSGRAVGKTMEIQRLNSMLDDIKANIRSHVEHSLYYRVRTWKIDLADRGFYLYRAPCFVWGGFGTDDLPSHLVA